MSESTSSKLSITEAREQFVVRPGYLNTASLGVAPRPVAEVLHELTERWAAGDLTAPFFDQFVDSARSGFADLLGVPVDWIAADSTVSSLVGLVASSLAENAEVICTDGDFTSVLFPFLVRSEDREITVREVPLEAIADSIGPQTSLVAVSAVQSVDGRIADLAAIEQAAREHGAMTLIDATQAVGWLPVDARPFDFVIVAAYKWMLAPRGVAMMSVRPERWESLRPQSAGWYAGEDIWSSVYGSPLRLASSARRFDVSPAWFSWAGAARSIEFLQQVGIESIREHNLGLTEVFAERLGIPAPNSAILSVSAPGAMESLQAAGIVAARRGDGTRLSFHLYNTEEDAIAAADALRSG